MHRLFVVIKISVIILNLSLSLLLMVSIIRHNKIDNRFKKEISKSLKKDSLILKLREEIEYIKNIDK